jgi:putative addiction module component (TIGR02574 family)
MMVNMDRQVLELAPRTASCSLLNLVSAALVKTAFELPPEERLELARRLVESVVSPETLTEAMTEGIRRIEDVAASRVAGLTEEQYRAALA